MRSRLRYRLSHVLRLFCTGVIISGVFLFENLMYAKESLENKANNKSLNNGEEVINFAKISYKVDVGGGKEEEIVGYHRGSDGQRVILIHGTPGEWKAWEKFLLLEPEGYDFVAVTRIGFAKGQGALTSLQGQAETIALFLKEYGVKKTILVGHSLGGPIALALAQMYPEKVGGVLLLASSFAPELETTYLIQRHLIPKIKFILPGSIYNSNEELLVQSEELGILVGDMDKLETKISIIHGKKDGLVPVGNVEYMKKHIAKERIHKITILPSKGHLLIWDKDVKPMIIKEIIEISNLE